MSASFSAALRLAAGVCCFPWVLSAEPLHEPRIVLTETLSPSPVKSLEEHTVLIKGAASDPAITRIGLRVTTSGGATYQTTAAVRDGHFEVHFPEGFSGAPALKPCLLYVDAWDSSSPAPRAVDIPHSEITLVVSGQTKGERPDLPLVFTDDFVDARGQKDRDCAQWERARTLVNLFVHSRGARKMGIFRQEFDLLNPADYRWFQTRASLYDFSHRDRDWSTPLGNRPARGFWNAMWPAWFNATNDHPWDGNPQNRDPQNFRPYSFANDLADILVLYENQKTTPKIAEDNRVAMAEEVLQNLLAMQHRSAESFALREASGKQENYTAGAFRYGLFSTGEWLTEGTGWFYNPNFKDFIHGGVFNARSLWALGERLKAAPSAPRAPQIRDAICLTLRFCLRDAVAAKTARLTRSGLPVWGIPGEHGYLLLGMLAACEVAPDLQIPIGPDDSSKSLREVCSNALDALAEIVLPDGTWTHYANVDAINIAALAEGARVLRDSADANRWKTAAQRAADVWINLLPLNEERTAPTPLFAHRKGAGITFFLGQEKHPHVSLYLNGHWIHALANLLKVAPEKRYQDRAEKLLAYYCGANPIGCRILTEIGAISNRITDSNNDGIEDQFAWDAYPESTAFVQIGLLHYLEAQAAFSATQISPK